MSENLKLDMTVDEALAFAEEWTRGMTLHAGSQGWRVVCLLLGEEVRALREENERLERIYDCFATEDADLLRRIGAQLEDIDYLGDYAEGVRVILRNNANLESQLAELRQGGEDFRSCSCTDGQTVCKHIAGSPACSYEHPLISAIPPGHRVVPDAMTFLRDNDMAASDDWMQGWNDCRAMIATPADSKEGAK